MHAAGAACFALRKLPHRAPGESWHLRLGSTFLPGPQKRHPQGHQVLCDRQLAEVAEKAGTGKLPAMTATCSHRIIPRNKNYNRNVDIEQLEVSKYTCLPGFVGRCYMDLQVEGFRLTWVQKQCPFHCKNRLFIPHPSALPLHWDHCSSHSNIEGPESPQHHGRMCCNFGIPLCFVLPGRERDGPCVGLDELVSRTRTSGKSSSFCSFGGYGQMPRPSQDSRGPRICIARLASGCLPRMGQSWEKTIGANARPSCTCPGGRAA